jgi:DnaK suppressor protein
MSLSARNDEMITQTVHEAWVERRLDTERERLLRAIVHVRAVDLDQAPDDHDRDDIVWQADDAANAASSTFARESGYGLIEDFDFLLHELDEADRRLRSGSYGICEHCGETISPDRLDAVPATRWCLTCAQGEERRRHRAVAPLTDSGWVARERRS